MKFIRMSALSTAARRWSNLREFVNEVSQARIWAGFHYRFSTRAGEEMGRQIGVHV